MTYFRHAVRHLQVSVERRLHEVLNAARWFGPRVPFGTTPVELILADTREVVKPNLVAVIFGDESAEQVEQLGGGLSSFTLGIGLDVIGDGQSITTAIAADVMDGLSGRNPAFSRFLEVRDHVQDVVRDDWSAEFVEVQRLKPDPMEWRPNWLALSAMLDVTFRSED